MVSKNRLILLLGLWVALMPFLGFPSVIETILYVASGLAVAFLSYLIARHRRMTRKARPRKERSTEVYVENTPSVAQQREEVQTEPLATGEETDLEIIRKNSPSGEQHSA